MIKMSRKAKKAMAVALTAGMLASTAATPVMAATEGWKKNSTGWWYQNADGSWPANKWEKINGSWYYFDANGYMKANSWAQDASGKWYYLGVNGAMKVNSWAQDASGKWYFVGADGAMKANSWAQDASGKWYFLGADGAMVTNTWAKDSSNLWYYLGADGVMEAGKWITVGDKSYFLAADGVMQSGVITVDGKTYYLGASDDGAMKTGEQTVAATKYNFGTDGACTDEKAPAADKHFDKNGNEIVPEVEVETIAGITGKITNALPDYQEDYKNVVFAGQDANYKVLVTDSNGKPVVGTPVSLKLKLKDNAHSDKADLKFGVKDGYVKQTDSEGYVYFVIGSANGVTATSGDYALFELTATAVQTNQTTETTLAFATISLGEVDALNDNKDSGLKVVPSTNAKADMDYSPLTYTIDGKKKTEYVATQQVSSQNGTEHKVVFELNPQIVIPVATSSQVISDYQLDVNKEIKEYSVYEDGENTSFKVEKIPAGLKYATMYFTNIDISEYTRVEIHPYKAGTTEYPEGKGVYIIDGATTQKNFGYQIPVQENDELDIVVKVISEGQVDDDQNGGLVVSEVVGVYDAKKNDGTKTIDLENSVKWSVVENKYSNEITFKDTKDAIAYIPSTVDPKYISPDNTYSYQVPVYPYSGNAIMTVKDKNKKVVGYFTIPTRNFNKNGNYTVGAAGFQNENDLVPAAKQAILVSYDEAFNTEGTIKVDGNRVEVNSEKTGVTAIEAKLDLSDYKVELDATNNTVYTSVHWSPIPTAEATVESKDFYALVGQNITVKAQLVDNNGNKVAQAGETITYEYGKTGEINKLGALEDTTGATVTAYTATTDANGQATIKITSGDEQALVDMLHATCKKYNVQLVIGDTAVTNANLRWVEAGLSFTDSVLGKTTSTIENASEVTVKDKLSKKSGTNWIMGYEVVGDTQDGETTNRWVDSITGLKVDVSKGGVGEITTTGMANGTAKVTSTKSGSTTLTGTINENSVVSGTDVIFKVAIDTDKDGDADKFESHKNVGEGVPSINSSLNIPIAWDNVGTQIEIIAPKGISMVVPKDGETVYVKVTDSFGDEIEEKVEVSVTYSDGKNTVKATYDEEVVDINSDVNKTDIDKDGLIDKFEKTSDPDTGLVEVSLPKEIGGIKPKTATITAKVGNETTQKTINYKEDTTATVKFAIGDVVYEAQSSSSNPKVRVLFTTPVNKDTLNVDMFTIKTKDGKRAVPIAKAELDASHSNEVILTLDNQYANGLNNEADYVVTIEPNTVKGITYTLCDSYYRTFDSKAGENCGYEFNKVNPTNEFTTADYKLADAREDLEDAKKTVEAANKEAAEKAEANKKITADVALIDEAVIGSDKTAVINLSDVAKNGSTVTVTGTNDGVMNVDPTEKTVTVTMSDGNAGKGATFTVTVSNGTGIPVTNTYAIVNVDADSYDVVAQGTIDAALTALTSAIEVVPSVASYAASAQVDFGTSDVYKVTKVTVSTDTDAIFADNDGENTLSLNSNLDNVDTDSTATVTVVYTHKAYDTVTKEVEYNVSATASDSINVDGISFES